VIFYYSSPYYYYILFCCDASSRAAVPPAARLVVAGLTGVGVYGADRRPIAALYRYTAALRQPAH
jgi:hypothetical protein